MNVLIFFQKKKGNNLLNQDQMGKSVTAGGLCDDKTHLLVLLVLLFDVLYPLFFGLVLD